MTLICSGGRSISMETVVCAAPAGVYHTLTTPDVNATDPLLLLFVQVFDS